MPTPARPRASRPVLRLLVVALLTATAALAATAPATAAPAADGALARRAGAVRSATDDPPAPDPASGRQADDAAAAPIVLVGVTGLRWDDVTTLTTPALWDLSREGAVGLVATRSVRRAQCPADGWLAVSSGQRAADLPADDRTCRTLREPGEDGLVPGWVDFRAGADSDSYGAQPGMLGDLLAANGTPVAGIGPGAAIALADSDGRPVGTHQPRPTSTQDLTRTVRDALSTNRLVVVDGGVIRDPGRATKARGASTGVVPEGPVDQGIPGLVDPRGPDLPSADVIADPTRAYQAQTLDERIGAVLRGAQRSGATVLVMSLADSSSVVLQLGAATGPAPDGSEYTDALLTSGSTRQAGVVQTVDVTPTLLDSLGLLDQAPALAGATILPTPGAATATARFGALLDVQKQSTWIRRVTPTFSTRLVVLQAVLFVAAAVLLTRTGRSDTRPLRPALQVLRIAAVALAAAPIASFLTAAVPWWQSAVPRTAFWGTLVGWVTVITAVACLGPWRRSLLGPAGLVAGVTVAVLVVDACTGSTLVIDTPMGAHRLEAARFYGMSNPAFALLTAGGLLLAVAIADPLVRRGRRALAAGLVVGLGILLVVVDGTPGLGSDFGGPPAMILAFTLLAVVVSGRTVSWRTVAIVIGVGAVVVAGFAVLDWLRPPTDRTHLGRFFATVLDGGLWDVLYRKVAVNLRVLTNWRYLTLAVGGVALTWIVLAGSRPQRGALMGPRSPLSGLSHAVPLLRPAVAAIGAGMTVGLLINDSGIIVPATGIALAVPCLVAAAAQWRLGAPDDVTGSGLDEDTATGNPPDEAGTGRTGARADDDVSGPRSPDEVSGASAGGAEPATPSGERPTPPDAHAVH